MAAPFIYRSTSVSGNNELALLKAAMDGDLNRVKGIIKNFGKGRGNRGGFSLKNGGSGVLHTAACTGHLEICKYLIGELGADPNMIYGEGPTEGTTAFMASAQSGDISTVKYFLERGGDIMKPYSKGRTVLHHAVSAGSCKVTEFLLSKGIPVDIEYGHGTPLYHASINEQDKTLKILLDHHANPNTIFCSVGTPLNGDLLTYRSLKCMKLLIKVGADVNGKGCVMSPLVFATGQGGYTKFIPLLLKAGADPNLPDDLGQLPIELAASHGCREEVEMLFPLTKLIPGVRNWSVDGVISHAKLERAKPMTETQIKERRAILKSQADQAFRRKEYKLALECYNLVIDHKPDATVYSNRSLCKLLMGDGEGALSDAYQCRMMRPDWAKACYRQAAAHMLLKEYKQACDALRDAQKLDPGNDEIERELSKAMELMKISPSEDQQ